MRVSQTIVGGAWWDFLYLIEAKTFMQWRFSIYHNKHMQSKTWKASQTILVRFEVDILKEKSKTHALVAFSITINTVCKIKNRLQMKEPEWPRDFGRWEYISSKKCWQIMMFVLTFYLFTLAHFETLKLCYHCKKDIVQVHW
mgnify:CR=1 FL=1